MARGHTARGYTGFGIWISWECGACGDSDEIQADSDDGNVNADIDHYCEVDEEY